MTDGAAQGIPDEPATLRIISINPELTGDGPSRTQLHYQYERGLYEAANRLGIEYIVIAGAYARPPAEFPGIVLPSLVDGELPLDPSEWPTLWSGRASRDLCASVLAAVDRVPPLSSEAGRTAFFLYHGQPAHIAGLIRLGLALRGTCPIILNLYHLHAMYGLHRPARLPGLRGFLEATRELRRAANLHLRVDSARVAEFLRWDTGEEVAILPFFSPSGEEVADGARPRPADAPFRLVYPTARAGRDKGFDLVVALAERLGRPDVEIVSRETLGDFTEICLPTKAAFAGGLQILPSFLPDARYEDMLSQSDLVLIPYARWQFLSRTSGIVADAIRLGKPMVGTADCWIGDQIDALGAGKTFRDGDVDDFIRAVRAALEQIGSLRKSLLDRRAGWLQSNNLSSFLRAILNPDGAVRPPLGDAKRDWLLARLWFVTCILLPWRSEVTDSILTAFRRARQRLRGRSGWLSSSIRSALMNRWRIHPIVRWRTRGVKQAELRLGTPDGFRVGGDMNKNYGHIWPLHWVTDRSWLYLQDISDGRPLLAKHTLARLRFPRASRFPRSAAQVEDAPISGSRATLFLAQRTLVHIIRWIFRFRRGDLHLSGPPLRRDIGTVATLAWDTTCPGEIELFVNGKLFARGSGRGSIDTGPWVKLGARFELRDGRLPVLPPSLRMLDGLIVTVRPGKPALTATGRLAKLVAQSIDPGRARHPPRQVLTPPIEHGEPLASPSTSVDLLATLEPNEWAVVCPPTSGEIYLLCRYARTFLDKYGGECLVIVAPAGHLDILRLFPDAPVRGLDRDKFSVEELDMRGRIGRLFKLDYGCAGWGRDGVIGRYPPIDIGFAPLFMQEIGITLDMTATQPRVMPVVRAAALDRMRELKLVQGRTVLLAPTSSSQQPLPWQSWQHIADVLSQRGFTVATNCGPGESPLPGTPAWTSPISELYAATEIGGFFISTRNGLCEVCCTADTNFHILMDDLLFSLWPAVNVLRRLAENGLPDKAVYHTKSNGEPALGFADRVLAHPDLQQPPEP